MTKKIVEIGDRVTVLSWGFLRFLKIGNGEFDWRVTRFCVCLTKNASVENNCRDEM
jgi:hypothetical protein